MHISKLRFWSPALLLFLCFPPLSQADVFVYWLDTSGSMRHHGFEEAKAVLIREVEAAHSGDVLFIGTFDTSDRLLGRLAVGEDGSPDAKADLIAKIQGLKADGKWTNLDMPVKSAKAMLLEERAPGVRRIMILSDGLSDPAPGFEKIDLEKISEMVPQKLGFSLYLIGLPEDIAGLFQAQPEGSGVVTAPEAPHIKGIALKEFTRERIEEGVKIAKEDPPTPSGDSVPPSPSEEAVKEPSTPFPLSLFLLGAGLLLVVGSATWWMGRNGEAKPHQFTLEVREGNEETKRFALAFGPRTRKKTIGPRGDIPLHDSVLPPVVFSLLWEKGRLWLIPQDSITMNSRPVTAKTAVSPGDLIGVRESVKIVVDEKNAKGDEP